MSWCFDWDLKPGGEVVIWHSHCISTLLFSFLLSFFFNKIVLQIYLMDILIWYTILSAIVGGVKGARARLGEVLMCSLRVPDIIFYSLFLFQFCMWCSSACSPVTLVLTCVDCVYLWQIRSIEMVHKRFESFPAAFVNNLVSPMMKRWSLFYYLLMSNLRMYPQFLFPIFLLPNLKAFLFLFLWHEKESGREGTQISKNFLCHLVYNFVQCSM